MRLFQCLNGVERYVDMKFRNNNDVIPAKVGIR